MSAFKLFLYPLIVPHLVVLKMAGADTSELVKQDKAIMDAERGRHGLAYYLVNYPTYRNLFYQKY